MPWASSKGAEEAAGHSSGYLQAWKKLGPLSQPGPRRREHNQGHDVVSRAESRSYQPQEGNTRAISECPGVQVLTGQRGVGRQAGRHQLPGKDSVSWKLVTGNQGKRPSL